MGRLLLLICFFSLTACAQEEISGTAFRRYFTRDNFGRRISFFLSGDAAAGRSLPLAVWVQGTGCSSLFERKGESIAGKAQVLVQQASRGRAAVLAVEKPGVEFLDAQPDAADASTCRGEFLREHTLDRWAEAIAAAIRAAQKLPGVDPGRTLVMGGSEGGMVAVRVSNLLPSVTHAASLAGGGPNHLFDLAEYMRRRNLDPEKEVYACWADVQRDPDSITKFCWGHPFRQLSTFLKTSMVQECLQSHAKLYLVHGTADEQNSVVGFDVLRAELAAKGKAAVFGRIDGAGHSMNRSGEDPGDAMLHVFGRIFDWFLAPDAP